MNFLVLSFVLSSFPTKTVPVCPSSLLSDDDVTSVDLSCLSIVLFWLSRVSCVCVYPICCLDSSLR